MTYKMGDPSADYSVFVSNVVDVMGYSMDTIRQRRQLMMDEFDECGEDEKAIICGSKGEGTSSFFESDFDFMCVPSRIICTADASRYLYIADTTVFQTEYDNVCPGYTYLKVSFDEYTHIPELFVKLFLLDEYIPSVLGLPLVSELNTGMTEFDTGFGPFSDRTLGIEEMNSVAKQGPSLSGILSDVINTDMVLALKCEFPDITKQFLSRHRKFNQPPKETLEEVAKLDSHVVAVGSKRGDRPDLEWRICYTEAELHLMRCMNETQIKVYTLLKLLAKSNIEDSKTISSYILKNIVLWMSELMSRDTFRPTQLVQRLLDALRLLRLCVKYRYLPNYMIPERNMFCGKLKHPEHLMLVQQLTMMVDEGEHVLFLCPRLKQAMVAMYDSPIKARHIGNLRDAIEQWYWQSSLGDDKDDEIDIIVETVCKREIEEYRDYKISADTFNSRVYEKLQKLLL